MSEPSEYITVSMSADGKLLLREVREKDGVVLREWALGANQTKAVLQRDGFGCPGWGGIATRTL